MSKSDFRCKFAVMTELCLWQWTGEWATLATQLSVFGNELLVFLKTNWTYLIIPFVSAVVGWGTNVLALKMTFYPLEFIGIPPYLGWQGIIPSKAGRMAGMSVDLLTANLIRIEEVFARLEPERVAEEMQDDLQRISKEIINRVMNAQAPKLWKILPEKTKENLYNEVANDFPQVVEELMVEFKEHITELFDLRGMVVETLLEDRALLNTIFIKCGEREFKFIERSGLYFGFLFGIVQMIFWFHYSAWWILPVAGLFVGYATNWLALRLIFSPLHPYKIGPWTIQGLFLKRQKEVAAEYSRIVASRILTPEKVYDDILYGKATDKLSEIVEKHVQKVVDITGAQYQPLFDLISKKRIDTVRNIISFHFNYDFPILMRSVYDYTQKALKMEETMREKMSNLSSPEFQGFLRPVFQEDELKLILVGAFLGGLAGLAQLYLLF